MNSTKESLHTTAHHHHDHHHHHGPSKLESLNKIFIFSILLNTAFVLIEALVGWHYNSLSLLSDAGHNLSDVFCLFLSLLAFRMAKIRMNKHFTYGYKKTTILASFINGLILLIAIAGIIVEAIYKISNPSPISGGAITITASIGIVINGLTAYLLMKNQKEDLNVRGAFIHMVMDTVVSLGVVVSGIIIIYTDWVIVDSIVSLIIAAILLYSVFGLFKESLFLLLDAKPASIDMSLVEAEIEKVEGIKSWHHLHVWSISTTENASTLHLVLKDYSNVDAIKAELKQRFLALGIHHTTIECELEDSCCGDKQL